jgi:hypothetical protein
MRHPFLALDPRQQKALFWPLLIAALAITAIMNILGRPLITSQAPAGIVSFELAGSPERAQAILATWDEQARMYAAFGLGFDYLYMLAYSMAIGLGCLLAAGTLRSRQWPLAGLGVPLAWGMALAAICDATENLGLSMVLLAGAAGAAWPALARLCAMIKFGLLFLGLVYAFYGLAIWFVGRLNR